MSSLLHSGNSYLILFPAAVSIDGGGWAVGGRGVGRAVGRSWGAGGGREGGRWGGGSGEAGSKKIHAPCSSWFSLNCIIMLKTKSASVVSCNFYQQL